MLAVMPVKSGLRSYGGLLFVAMMVSYYMTHLMISTKIGCLFLGDRKFVKQ